jgi:hypothetical protein
MFFDRQYTRGRTPYGSFDLVTWSTTLNVRVASNHSVLPIGHDSVLSCNGSVLLSLLLGGYFAIMSVPLLLWGLLLISTPGIQLKKLLFELKTCGAADGEEVSVSLVYALSITDRPTPPPPSMHLTNKPTQK